MAVGVILKKELEKVVDLGRARNWLRKMFFEVVLRDSHTSERAIAFAKALKPWLTRLGIPTEKLGIVQPGEHQQGLRQVVGSAFALVWGASLTARTDDRTLQFGMWLRVVGLATLALGVQFTLADAPGELIRMEFALGLSLLGVGHFLGALRYRKGLWVALLVLGLVTVFFDTRIAVAGPGWLLHDIVRLFRQAGSAAAAMACVLVAMATRMPSSQPKGRAVDGSRALLIRVGMRLAGLGCLCYSLANFTQAFMVAPSRVVQATHLVIAACLAMAARECTHDPSSYDRLASNDGEKKPPPGGGLGQQPPRPRHDGPQAGHA